MRIASGPFWIDIQSDLLARTLELAAGEAPEELHDEYEREREAVASIETVDIREASFRELDARWVERFGVLDRLRRVLIEERGLGETVSGLVVLPPLRPEGEGMLLEPEGLQTSGVLTLRLAPETLLSLPRLRKLLSDGIGR